jgi:predicted ABC-type transport system involved in lysophospholipase L1 biosynthesis ATPase subunit
VVGPKQSTLRIVDSVSFTVPRLGLFAINGPSGSGKTTLLNLVTGIDRPSSGAVLFDGKPVAAGSENALARWRGRHIGIIFQFFHLIPTLTAFENVLLALELGGAGGAAALEVARPGEQLPGVGRDGLLSAQAAERAVGRPAAARGDRPRHRQRSPADRRRRADREPRLQDGRRRVRPP